MTPVLRLSVVAALAVLLRRGCLRWGATNREAAALVPGDELISDADLTATRAVTIHAPVGDVWPWVAQLGQGRGGFYSYDFLENLMGCDIHSSDRIVPEWQTTDVGDAVNLYPEVGLIVARVDPGRALVLRGPPPMGGMRAPCDFTWAFALRDGADGTTRLVVRERYAYAHWSAALLVEPVEVVSFVMSRRMLRGIRDRAEPSGAFAPAVG